MENPRHWRLKAQRYRLQGWICLICGEPSFPPRPICPDCTAQAINVADVRLPLITDSVVIAAFPTHIRRQVTDSTTG